MSKYKRIACSYYDVFESYATQKTLLKITYSDKQGLRQELISKIKTLASTAIPIVNTIPAIPGRVKVAPIVPNRDIIIKRLAIREIFAINPKEP